MGDDEKRASTIKAYMNVISNLPATTDKEVYTAFFEALKTMMK